MIDITTLQNISYFGNTGKDYALSLILLVVSLLIFFIIRYSVVKHLGKMATTTKNDFDDLLIKQIKKIHWPFLLFFSIVIGLQALTFNETIENVIRKIALIVITYLIAIQLTHFITYSLDKIMRQQSEGGNKRSNAGILQLLNRFVGIIIWSVGLLFVLSNLGVDITSIIAGLGVGGIAIAFAVQNILSDIFSSFAIYFDRPFEVGDFIVVGEHAGTVQHIGIKSTKMKALRGELLIISNKEIMSSRIQNFRKLEKRRIVFNIGITYETPVETISKIPEFIKKAFMHVDKAELDRAHFSEFGESALLFEVVYYVIDPSYVVYRDMQQKINIHIMKIFNDNKIEFAYPTRTIYTK